MKKGTHHTKETLLKISKAHEGRTLKPEHRIKVIKTLVNGQRGDKNPNWKGGVTKSNSGYLMIKNLDHPYKNSNGYISEHRLVMENKLGRYLLPGEQIHHINEDKTDNRIENLRIVTVEEHADIHWNNDKSRQKQSALMKMVRKSRFWTTRKTK